MELNIGIDDTDSTKGGCTTYIGARLVEDLSQKNVRFIDYPNIIRLNPNIPYKTRGNAAVALRLNIQADTYDDIMETVIHEVEENSRVGEAGTDPAVVLLKGRPTSEIKQLSQKCMQIVVSVNAALRVAKSSQATAVTYGTKLGLVGALAAVGQTLDHDHTFELVAYRTHENWGRPRRVDDDSVRKMDQATAPGTFNNYDYENKRTLITPHGPDPVLLGIRGENPEILVKAFRMLKILEPVERWTLFRTNHGTDAHLQPFDKNRGVKTNSPIVLRGTVANKPTRIPGGHVFFTLKSYRRGIECAAFEPTGRFREVVSELLPGDVVTVYGGVKRRAEDLPLQVNLEKLFIHRLAKQVVFENPLCPTCKKRMKSAGRGQGFRCERCAATSPNGRKIMVRKPRMLRVGLYIPDKKANRHLTKPISRYGFERKHWNHLAPSAPWHEP